VTCHCCPLFLTIFTAGHHVRGVRCGVVGFRATKMAKSSGYATPGDRHAPRSRAACDSEHQADCIVLTVGVRSPMSRISTCEACFSVPRLVPFSGGSRPRSDPEALAGCCRVSLILLHRGVAVVARWARFSWCFPTTALLPSPHPAVYPSPPSPLHHHLRRPVAAT